MSIQPEHVGWFEEGIVLKDLISYHKESGLNHQSIRHVKSLPVLVGQSKFCCLDTNWPGLKEQGVRKTMSLSIVFIQASIQIRFDQIDQKIQWITLFWPNIAGRSPSWVNFLPNKIAIFQPRWRFLGGKLPLWASASGLTGLTCQCSSWIAGKKLSKRGSRHRAPGSETASRRQRSRLGHELKILGPSW